MLLQINLREHFNLSVSSRIRDECLHFSESESLLSFSETFASPLQSSVVKHRVSVFGSFPVTQLENYYNKESFLLKLS